MENYPGYEKEEMDKLHQELDEKRKKRREMEIKQEQEEFNRRYE